MNVSSKRIGIKIIIIAVLGMLLFFKLYSSGNQAGKKALLYQKNDVQDILIKTFSGNTISITKKKNEFFVSEGSAAGTVPANTAKVGTFLETLSKAARSRIVQNPMPHLPLSLGFNEEQGQLRISTKTGSLDLWINGSGYVYSKDRESVYTGSMELAMYVSQERERWFRDSVFTSVVPVHLVNRLVIDIKTDDVIPGAGRGARVFVRDLAKNDEFYRQHQTNKEAAKSVETLIDTIWTLRPDDIMNQPQNEFTPDIAISMKTDIDTVYEIRLQKIDDDNVVLTHSKDKYYYGIDTKVLDIIIKTGM